MATWDEVCRDISSLPSGQELPPLETTEGDYVLVSRDDAGRWQVESVLLDEHRKLWRVLRQWFADSGEVTGAVSALGVSVDCEPPEPDYGYVTERERYVRAWEEKRRLS